MAAAVLAGATLFTAGCSAGSTATQLGRIADANAIVVALAAAPASLDFTTTAGAAVPQAMMGNIYEGLVRIDDDANIQPLLAERWDISPDGRVYTFHLRQGVTFSNGDPFNAQAAKFSIDRVQSDAWTNGLKKQMEPVESTRVIDEHTLEVTLKEKNTAWLWNMGTLIGAMFSPTGIDDLANTPIGTGPYVVDSWAVGQSLIFTAREDYWGEKPKNSAAALRYFADPVGASNALQSGDVDVIYSLQSPQLMDELKATGKYTIEVGTTNGEVILSMNPRRAPFNDIRVRQAVMYAINRQDVIDTAWDGYGTDTGGAPVPPTDPWYEESTRYPYDPDKARELLKQAGIPEGYEVTISVPSLAYAQAASEMIVSQLNDVGLKVSIESTEFPAVWLSKVYKGHDFDMSIVAHVEARDIPAMFGNPEYYIGYDNPKVQQLLKQAGESDEVGNMKAAVDQIMEDAAADTLFNLPNIVVTDPGITGVDANSVVQELKLATMEKKDK
ncbi:peptide ABC transporter substrate-binding protein [Corynebacterium aquilae DSM 44791]|uniref:Peptide ABC transporter substrate-binding protein n=1 Tax=Corynebacterium aquilae DSM 44791 TaxID=1431546 RepID=A0A1L7CH90_9CORY|nr:peptide ABC transporter substrate-binding protein [Corynebacterium aquilae DSM 44791]